MTELLLDRTGVGLKHRGGWAEMVASAWLLQQGYEVLRNVSQHGSVDLVAIKGGEVVKFDVKSRNAAGAVSQFIRRTAEQVELGVKILVVSDDSKVRIIDDAPGPEGLERRCLNCGNVIERRRAKSLYCSKRCCNGVKQVPRACLRCGGAFVGRASTLYCSPSCSGAVERLRKEARRKAAEANEISEASFPAPEAKRDVDPFCGPSGAIP